MKVRGSIACCATVDVQAATAIHCSWVRVFTTPIHFCADCVCPGLCWPAGNLVTSSRCKEAASVFLHHRCRHSQLRPELGGQLSCSLLHLQIALCCATYTHPAVFLAKDTDRLFLSCSAWRLSTTRVQCTVTPFQMSLQETVPSPLVANKPTSPTMTCTALQWMLPTTRLPTSTT